MNFRAIAAAHLSPIQTFSQSRSLWEKKKVSEINKERWMMRSRTWFKGSSGRKSESLGFLSHTCLSPLCTVVSELWVFSHFICLVDSNKLVQWSNYRCRGIRYWMQAVYIIYLWIVMDFLLWNSSEFSLHSERRVCSPIDISHCFYPRRYSWILLIVQRA